MYVLYVDEFGCPEKTHPSCIFGLCGIAIEESNCRGISRELHEKYRQFYPRWFKDHKMEIDFLKKREKYLKRIVKPTMLRGKGNRRNRIFINDVVEMCDKNKVKVFPAITIKNKLTKEPARTWLYPRLLQKITVLFNGFLNEKRANGLIILDSNAADFEDELTFKHMGFLFGSYDGLKCKKIIGPPLFLKSHFSNAIQISNYMSSLINAHYADIYQSGASTKIDYSYMEHLWPKVNSLIYGEEHIKIAYILRYPIIHKPTKILVGSESPSDGITQLIA